MLLSNWEEQIVYSPDSISSNKLVNGTEPEHSNKFANPTNTALESGEWTKSIIWEPNASFRNFTQLELQEVDDVRLENNGQGTFNVLSKIIE